jgi:hypothetical protein
MMTEEVTQPPAEPPTTTETVGLEPTPAPELPVQELRVQGEPSTPEKVSQRPAPRSPHGWNCWYDQNTERNSSYFHISLIFSQPLTLTIGQFSSTWILHSFALLLDDCSLLPKFSRAFQLSIYSGNSKMRHSISFYISNRH